MKIEIRNASGGQYYWRIVEAGRVLATSETYVSKAGCTNALSTVKTGAATAPVYDLTR